MITKTLKTLLLLLTILTLGGCTKEDPAKECEVNKYGTITISNSSSNPYDIYIDGLYKMRLSGNSISTEIKVSEGNDIKLYAEQVSGYIFFPTKKTDYLNVLRCSSYGWQIP